LPPQQWFHDQTSQLGFEQHLKKTGLVDRQLAIGLEPIYYQFQKQEVDTLDDQSFLQNSLKPQNYLFADDNLMLRNDNELNTKILLYLDFYDHLIKFHGFSAKPPSPLNLYQYQLEVLIEVIFLPFLR